VLDLTQANQSDVAGAELEAIGHHARLDRVVGKQLACSPGLIIESHDAILEEADRLVAAQGRCLSPGVHQLQGRIKPYYFIERLEPAGDWQRCEAASVEPVRTSGDLPRGETHILRATADQEATVGCMEMI